MIRWLWIAVAVQLLGRLLDLRWHLTHDEFEGAAQQLEAHWLLWLGVVATLAVAVVALYSRPAGLSSRWLTAVAVSAVAYMAVATWHFIEHANGADPELAHALLAVAQIAMVAAVVAVTMGSRTRRPTVLEGR